MASCMNKALLALLLLLVVLGGCKSKRKSAKEAPAASAFENTALQRFEQLQRNDTRFEELSMQGSLQAELGGNSFSSAVSMKLQQNRQLWVSIKPMLGIEAFRALIRPDSIFLLDRINKQYVAKPFSYLQQMSGAPLTFAALQDVLLNNCGFLAGQKPQFGTEKQLIVRQQGMEYQLLASSGSNKLDKLLLKREQQELEVSYLKMQPLEKFLVPETLKMQISGSQPGTIEVNFSKFAVENGQTYPFSIPGNYGRMD